LDSGTVPTVWYFSIGFRNCFDSVVLFYWIQELFRQCGIFLLYSGTVPTVWYFSIGFRNCSDSVVLFYCIRELFRQCGIFLLYSSEQFLYPIEQCHTVGTVPESNRKIPRCRNSSRIKQNNTTL
jgi:hypothetical protein